jgi:hypothetical protein
MRRRNPLGPSTVTLAGTPRGSRPEILITNDEVLNGAIAAIADPFETRTDEELANKIAPHAINLRLRCVDRERVLVVNIIAPGTIRSRIGVRNGQAVKRPLFPAAGIAAIAVRRPTLKTRSAARYTFAAPQPRSLTRSRRSFLRSDPIRVDPEQHHGTRRAKLRSRCFHTAYAVRKLRPSGVGSNPAVTVIGSDSATRRAIRLRPTYNWTRTRTARPMTAVRSYDRERGRHKRRRGDPESDRLPRLALMAQDRTAESPQVGDQWAALESGQTWPEPRSAQKGGQLPKTRPIGGLPVQSRSDD